MEEKKKPKKSPEKTEETLNLKKERKQENKILRNVLIFIGIFFAILIASFIIMRFSNHPKYSGLTFNVIQEGQLTFYQTSIPTLHNGTVAQYNIYLRNDPKELKKEVPFVGAIDSIDNTVINITQEFDCNGDQVIAIANIVNLYGALNKKIMKDENASCDELGRYMYIVVQPGEETKIEKFGSNCYRIDIKDCEILQGTERFILEMLSKQYSDIYSN
jgi:hypothetical protein